MKSEILSQEKNIINLKVTIDKADFAAQLARTYANVAAKVSIPGFRKGHAPRNIIEMRYGKKTIMAEALEDLMPTVVEALVNQYELEPLGDPELKVDELEDNKDVVLELKFEVQPEVTLPDLSTIEVQRPVFNVTEEMVDQALDSLRKQKATFAKVNRASAKGDHVLAAYSTKIVDENGAVIVSHEPHQETFTLDEVSLRPEISAALSGASAGDNRTAELRVDDNYQDKKIAGKTAQYSFDIIEVQEPVLPELDEAFFKAATGKDLHSVEELRAEIRAGIEGRLKADAQNAAENEAVVRLTEAAKVDVPETMIERQRLHLRKNVEESLQKREHKTLEAYYAEKGQDLAKFEEQLKADALRDVKSYLVIDACAKEFGVTVEKGDLDGEIAQMADAYHVAPDSVKSMLQKRPDDLRSLISSARYRKAVTTVMSKVKIVDVKKDLSAEQPAEENGTKA